MTFHIAGKNVDIGEALRGHAETRIAAAVQKYFHGGFRANVVLEREGSGFRCECVVHLDSGSVLRTEATAADAKPAFEQAAERVEKRLRRYKRRLRDHSGGRETAIEAIAYVIQAPPGDEEEEPHDDNPVIIAEESTSLRSLSVSAAVMELDLAAVSVLVFRHAGHGGVNVVYRRADGNIGWIDPALPGRTGSAGG